MELTASDIRQAKDALLKFKPNKELYWTLCGKWFTAGDLADMVRCKDKFEVLEFIEARGTAAPTERQVTA